MPDLQLLVIVDNNCKRIVKNYFSDFDNRFEIHFSSSNEPLHKNQYELPLLITAPAGLLHKTDILHYFKNHDDYSDANIIAYYKRPLRKKDILTLQNKGILDFIDLNSPVQITSARFINYVKVKYPGKIDKDLSKISQPLKKEVLIDLFYNQLIDGFCLILFDDPQPVTNESAADILADRLLYNGTIAHFNSIFLEQLEIDPHEAKGLKPFVIYKNPDHIRRCMVDYFNEQKKVFEIQCTRKTDQKIWLEVNFSSIFNSNETLSGIFIVQRDITLRKSTQSFLRESEERYHKLTSLSFEGIAIQKNGIIKDVNDALVRITGFSRDQLTNKNFLNHLIPREYHHLFSANTGETGNLPVEAEIIDKKGYRVPVEIESEDISYRGEKFRVSSIKDIALKKQNEQEITKLSIALNQSANTVVITDIYGNIEYVNRAFTKITGYDADEVMGKNPRILKSGKMPNHFYTELWETISSGCQWEGEFLNKKKNGEFYWESTTITPVKATDGKVIRYIAIKENITGRKKAEEALRLSEEQHRTLVNNIPGIIYRCLYNDKMTMLYISHAIENFTGYKAKDFMNNVRTYPDIIHPDDLERVQDTIKMGVEYFKQYTTEYRIITKGKKIKWVMEKGTAVFNDNKNVKWLDGAIFDISDKVGALEELKKAKASAERANRSKSEFLANMSHEIRTPLNSILGFTELLEEITDNVVANNYLKSIKSSGKNLLTLINDILDLSKVESGKLELTYNYFDPGVLLKELVQVFSLKISRKKINLEIDIAPDFPETIYLDEVRFRQIMLNLVGNAIKFTDKGFVKVVLKAEERSYKNENEICRLIIEVIDTGIGISKQSQNLIFESFRQQYQHDSKKYEGTGLGLSITKRLVEIMNGSIEVDSEPGVGSKFTIRFPDINIKKTINQSNNNEFDYKVISFHSATLLIADDHEEIRRFIKSIFSNTSVKVLEAINGEESIKMTMDYKPDIVLMDILMPRINGFIAVQRIKSVKETSHIPIVAFTASNMKMSESDLQKFGFSASILKPVSVTNLYWELMRFLPYKFSDSDDNKIYIKSIRTKSLCQLHSNQVPDDFANTFNNQWQKFKRKQPLKEVARFAREVYDYGKKHQHQDIEEYGSELMHFINAFDVEKMREHLKNFNRLFESIN